MTIAIPQEWQDVLKEVQVVFPSAVIAGGALRDLMNNRPIKDVDIFIPIHEDYVGDIQNAYDAIWNLYLHEGITLDQASHYGTIKDDADRDLYAIFKLIRRKYTDTVIDGQCYQYDLILCKPEAAMLHTFDINICQITYDGKHVRFTGAYTHGVLTRTIKVMQVNRTDRNAARVLRMKEKYPEYTVEDNDEY